jgi:competence protein ComEA
MTSEDTLPTEPFPPRPPRTTFSDGRTKPGFFRQIAANRWAKPLVRLLSIAIALVVLVAIGSSARAIPSASRSNGVAQIIAPESPSASSAPVAAPPAPPTVTSLPTTVVTATAPGADRAKRATVDDPVILNSASLDDLERLPGIGPKRAAAILELRQKLGRFRQVEDLMRVKGVGRATLKKLRPIIRLD